MRQLELARLFLKKAGEDEALLDAVAQVSSVADATVGFHCQQAAEKLLKALLSALAVRFRRTHDLQELMTLLELESANPNGIPAQSPGLRGTSYPGSNPSRCPNPNGVAPRRPRPVATPLGLASILAEFSQGSSFLATLGWRTQSRWDSWRLAHSRRSRQVETTLPTAVWETTK